MPTAIALAEKIAANAPLSVQASRRVALGIDEGRIAADAPFWEHNTRERAALMRSEDARAGPLAFAQKRKPERKARCHDRTRPHPRKHRRGRKRDVEGESVSVSDGTRGRRNKKKKK